MDMLQTIARGLAALSVLLPFGGGASCNSSSDVVALPDPAADNPLAAAAGRDTIVVAGGCFWGIHAVLERLEAVLCPPSGYSGRATDTAADDSGRTGRTRP